MAREIDLGVDLSDVAITLGGVSIGVTAFSTWVTAVINAERCRCVALPLKVKKIFTVKITLALIFGMLVFQTASATVVLVPLRLSVVWSPVQNRPQIVLDQSTFYQRVSSILFFWCGGFQNFISCNVILASTIFMANALRQRKKILHSSTGQREREKCYEGQATDSIRYTHLNHLHRLFHTGLFRVSGIFCLSSIQVFDPYLGNIAQVGLSFTDMFQVVSSAVNIFFYFKMNSKYNKCLRTLFKQGSQ